jgi:hypothetical protein
MNPSAPNRSACYLKRVTTACSLEETTQVNHKSENNWKMQVLATKINTERAATHTCHQ